MKFKVLVVFDFCCEIVPCLRNSRWDGVFRVLLRRLSILDPSDLSLSYRGLKIENDASMIKDTLETQNQPEPEDRIITILMTGRIHSELAITGKLPPIPFKELILTTFTHRS